MLSHLPHVRRQQAKRGDFVVLFNVGGLSTGDHVVMPMQDVAGNADPFVASHGCEDDPGRYRLSVEMSTFTGQPPTFLQTVYDCHRQEATGNSSLDWVANNRHTSAGNLIDLTRNSHKYGRGYYGINDANLARFNEYVGAGTDKKMPPGLVYYTPNP
jgi:hypothetical protein